MITQAEVMRRLRYDRETGEFTWLESRSQHRTAGDTAGYVNGYGYRTIMLNGANYLAHRLAWLICYGEFPGGGIDHIDGDKLNNRISNLRPDPSTLNAQNLRRAKASSRSGELGVHWVPRAKKWRAQICVNRKSIHIGYFDTAAEAHKAYVSVKKEKHPFCTLGMGA